MSDGINDTKKGFKLMHFIKHYKLLLLLIIVASLGSAVIDILMAYFMRNIIDSSLLTQINELVRLALMLLGTLVIGVVIKFFAINFTGRLSANVVRDIRNKFTEHLCKAEVSYLDAGSTGDIISRHNNDIGIINGFIGECVSNIVYQPVVLICAIVFMIITSWKLLVVSIILFPVSFIIVSKISAPVITHANRMQQHLGESCTVVKDTLDGIQTVKSFGCESIRSMKYKNSIDDAVREAVELEKRRAFTIPVSIVLQILPFLICFIMVDIWSFKIKSPWEAC